MINKTLALTLISTSLLAAACGTDTSTDHIDPGPDAAVIEPPVGRSVIETCIAGGGQLRQAWATGNQHGAVTSITVTGTTVVLGSTDGSVKQWKVAASPSYGTSFDNGESGRPVTHALAVGSDGTVLGADASGAVSEWKLSDASPMRTTPVTTAALAAIAVDAGAKRVATGGGTDIHVVDRVARTTSPKLTTTMWDVDALAFGTGDLLITAGHWYSTPMIERRDAASPDAVADSWNDRGTQGHVRAVAVTADGKRVVAAGDGFVAVFDAANLAAGPLSFTAVPAHNAVGLVLLSGNELFATAGTEGTVQLWKAANAEHVATVNVPTPIGLGVDHPGAQLFTAGPDGMLRSLGCR